MAEASPPSNENKPKSAPQRALEKLGLVRDIDLALHLPLRYEDETRITRLCDAAEGDMVQIEATVTHCEVQIRGRRQLVATVDDGTDTCTLRFLNFYPSQQKALAVGNRVRARGEVRGGFAGLTMVHPVCKSAESALPEALTPVYPSSAALPQAYLRRAIQSSLGRADLSESIPPEILNETSHFGISNLHSSLLFLHYPAPNVTLATLEDRSHPAWQRLKLEELLAQQISQLQARQERAVLQAPALSASQAPDSLYAQLLASLPFGLTNAQTRVGEEIAQDLGRPVPMHRLLQGDVGAGKTVVAALAAARCIDAGLAMRADGAHGNSGGAAFHQAGRLAGAAARASRPARGLAYQ
jgi:ATP-dependent DNA helicase RecG